jgi:hypothetical protein
MRRGTLLGISAVTVLVTVVVLCSRTLFRSDELTPSWLSLRRSPSKPPPEQAAVEKDYAVARSKPCGKSGLLIHTTICDVLGAPEVFADKCVLVPGRFITDGLEHSVIVDESCKRVGLSPWATSKVTRELDQAIWLPEKGYAPDRRITARFTGRFVWRPKASRDVRVLEISAISNLKVEELPPR